MRNSRSTSDVNQTFIIEPLSITGGSPTLSASTALYTNEIISFSGNSNITLGTDVISFNTAIDSTNNLSVGTVGGYLVQSNTSAAGSFKINVTRLYEPAALSEAIVLRFVIIKATIT